MSLRPEGIWGSEEARAAAGKGRVDPGRDRESEEGGRGSTESRRREGRVRVDQDSEPESEEGGEVCKCDRGRGPTVIGAGVRP